MRVLIAKLGATGDVVRTTCLLRQFGGEVTWLTAAKNIVLLQALGESLRSLPWEERDQARERTYDLVINLEDDLETALFLKTLEAGQWFGAHLNGEGSVGYTDNSRGWFDLSLISRHGREAADRLKAENRRTYQDLIFSGLGFRFDGEPYLLPEPIETGLKGDVAMAPEGGPVWPMKNWAYFDQLKLALEKLGLTVNVLPLRASLLEHLCDVRNHRCLVSGDSLPMHFALGSGIPCVTLFTCTSPWEIFDYGLQTKIVSPLLEEFFYQRGFDPRATTAISVDEVLQAVLRQLEAPARRKHSR